MLNFIQFILIANYSAKDFLMHGNILSSEIRQQNRTEQNRTEQNRTLTWITSVAEQNFLPKTRRT